MANDYFDSIPVAIPEGTRARASQVNAVSQSVESAFDKLPTEEQLKEGTTRYAVDTGAANAYIVTLPYTITLQDGLNLYFKAVNANTGPSTINVNGTGAKAIRNVDGSELIANTFGANSLAQIIYNVTSDQWQLLTQSPEAEQAKIDAEAAAAAAAVSEANAAASESAAAGSAGAAATSASNASTSASNAATSEGNAGTSETNAGVSEVNADNTLKDFETKYLGSKASDPTLDNEGGALIDGALYWNTTVNEIRVYDLGGTTWAPLTASTDATSLQGLGPEQFLRSDENDTMVGNLTVDGNVSINVPAGTPNLNFFSNGASNCVINFSQGGTNRQEIVAVNSGNLILRAGNIAPLDVLTLDTFSAATFAGDIIGNSDLTLGSGIIDVTKAAGPGDTVGVFRGDAADSFAQVIIAGPGVADINALQLAQEPNASGGDAFIWNLNTAGDLRFGAGNNLAAVVDATTQRWSFQGAIQIGTALETNGNSLRAISQAVALGGGTTTDIILNPGSSNIILNQGPVDFGGGISEETVALTGSGSTNVDLEAGTIFTMTITGATTFLFINPGSEGNSFTLILTNGGSQTITYPGGVVWAGGSEPTLTVSGTDVLTFVTPNGGTTWYGFPAGLDFT